MESNSNFRLKVDLTKYHQDARRFSWIFVDRATCLFISHIKQHIVNIFGVHEPFHLLLNGNEYLPPTEDVRLLKENEIIAVVPGSGLNDVNGFAFSIDSPVIKNGQPELKYLPKSPEAAKVNPQDENRADSAVADIGCADSPASTSDVADIESATESKGTCANFTENEQTLDTSESSRRKRKRTRRKKSKKGVETTLSESIDNKRQKSEYQAKNLVSPGHFTGQPKPKIITSCVLPVGKHIRFDNFEANRGAGIENGADQLCATKLKQCDAKSPVSTSPAITDLSTLMALRQCSAPLTFENKRINTQIDNSFLSKQCAKRNDRSMEFPDSSMNTGATKNELSNGSNSWTKSVDKQMDYSELNPEQYPVLKSTTELNDVVAFKVLRIGDDYSPQVSHYIIAKTRDWCPETRLYSFEILRGHDQIQTPMGKFTLPENDMEDQVIDTAKFNFSQLIDPRLINRQ